MVRLGGGRFLTGDRDLHKYINMAQTRRQCYLARDEFNI